MIGIVGAEKLSKDGVMWHEQRCGNFYRLDELAKSGFDNITHLKRGHKEVEAIDGLLMATQYDIPWRKTFSVGLIFMIFHSAWNSAGRGIKLQFRRRGTIG